MPDGPSDTRRAPKPDDPKPGSKGKKGLGPFPKPDPNPPTKGYFILAAVQGPKAAVAGKKAELGNLDKGLGDRKGLGDALKDAEKQAPKLPEKKKRSMLAEIQAMRRDNDKAIDAAEDRKKEVAQELKQAERELADTRADAGKALRDDGKFNDFFDKHKDAVAAHFGSGVESLSPPEPLPEEPAEVGEGLEAAVRILRPSSDQPAFVIEAQKKAGELALPFPNVRVQITLPGVQTQARADALGRVLVSPRALAADWPKDTPRMELKAKVGKASRAMTVTRQELDHYLKQGAEILARQGDEELARKRYPEATRIYWESLQWSPSEKALDGWLAALEGQGPSHGTLGAYRVALAQLTFDPSHRTKLKGKAIELARQLTPPPSVSSEAVEQVKKGQELARTQGESELGADSLVHFEVASTLAPWWPDPYYAQAQVFQYLTFQKEPQYAQQSIQSYDLFLKAAGKDDPRIAEAKQERRDLSELMAMMSK